MENKAENKGNGAKIAIAGALITAVAGIITTIVSISGPLLDKRMAIQTTQTREAALLAASVGGAAAQLSHTPTAALPTAEVVVATRAENAALTAVPTEPLAPLPTKNASAATAQPQVGVTPAGTLLRVGESYTSKSGIAVKLTQVEFPAGNEVHLHFTFTNQSPKVMNLALDHNNNVTLTDDLGGVFTWASDFTWAVTIYPGTSRNDEVKRRGDVSQSSYFIIKLDMPGLLSAQWKN